MSTVVYHAHRDAAFRARINQDLLDAGLDVIREALLPAKVADWQTIPQHATRNANLLILCLGGLDLAPLWLRRILRYSYEHGLQVLVVWRGQNAQAQFRADEWPILFKYQHITFDPQLAAYEIAFGKLLHMLSDVQLALLRRPHAGGFHTPYKGLVNYQQLDSKLFFGRDELVRNALQHLQRFDVLALVGASGVGKSSLVQAGIIPKLRAGALANSEHWPVALFTPGTHPIAAVVQRLEHLQVDHSGTRLLDDKAIRIALDEANTTNDLFDRLLSHDTRLVLIIDQFEEVLTLTNEGERTSFLDIVRRIALWSTDRVLLIIALRAEFFSELRQYPDLAHIFDEQNLLIVNEPSPQDQQQILEAPPNLVGFTYPERFVERLLLTARHTQMSLLTLQYILYRASTLRHGSHIPNDVSQTLDTPNNVIAQTAEDSYGRLDNAQQAVLQDVLIHLLEVTSADGFIKVEVAQDDLAMKSGITQAQLQGAIAPFVAHDVRLLLERPHTLGSSRTLALAHERLAHHWPRLYAWVEQYHDDLAYSATLRKAASNWALHEHDAAFLLRGQRLEAAQDWLASRSVGPLQHRFIQASLCARDVAQQLAKTQDQREQRVRYRITRRLRLLLIFLIGLTTLLLYAANQTNGLF